MALANNFSSISNIIQWLGRFNNSLLCADKVSRLTSNTDIRYLKSFEASFVTTCVTYKTIHAGKSRLIFVYFTIIPYTLICFMVSSLAWTWFVPSQWETALLCNDVSHWLGASLGSALYILYIYIYYHLTCLTHWPLGDFSEFYIRNFHVKLMTDVSLVKLPSDVFNRILLMISQNWFR